MTIETANIKLVAFDLDGTLLDSSKRISASSIHCIDTLKRKGIIVTLITGRAYYGALPYVDQLDLDSFFSVSDSSLILNRRREFLYESVIPHGATMDAISQASKHGCNVILVENHNCDDAVIVLKDDLKSWEFSKLLDVEKEVYGFRDEILMPVRDFESMESLEPYLMFVFGPRNNISVLEEHFESHFNDRLNLLLKIGLSSRFHEELYETHGLIIMRPAGSSKAEGFKRILKHYKVAPRDAMYFGDWYNDVEALNIAGFPVLMGNAPEEIRNGNYHMTGTNDEDGIYDALKKIMLV